MSSPRQPEEIRCFCRQRPLLARADVDAKGRPFVHVKVHKQGRIMTEFIASGGVVRLRCRSCSRWHKVTFRPEDVKVKLEPLPDEIPI